METAEVTTRVKWEIDHAKSDIAFNVKHLMMTNVKGAFKEYTASIYTTGMNFLTLDIDFTANPASIDTGDEIRDEHLRDSDFFDIKQYKQIKFIANTIVGDLASHDFELSGDLTMKGITKRIKLDVIYNGETKDSFGREEIGFTVKGEINRKDWTLNWNSGLGAGGMIVSEEVGIDCEVRLIQENDQY